MDSATRFADELARLTKADERVGLAVSGGPDSLALLLLAHRVLPDRIAVATVDHGLRPEAKDEATSVAKLCADHEIPCDILTADWPEGVPKSNVQAAARDKRYALLVDWAVDRDIPVIATAHHREDMVETFLMRAMRGAGVAGLSAITKVRELERGVRLIRPLLRWSRDELKAIVEEAKLEAVDDPSNVDFSYDRARLRDALAKAELGDLSRIAESAAHLREVEEALDWTAERLADRRLRETENGLALVRGTIPNELLRRLVLIAFARLGDRPPRGPDLARAMETLENGGKATLGKTLMVSDGELWTFSPAPPRRGD